MATSEVCNAFQWADHSHRGLGEPMRCSRPTGHAGECVYVAVATSGVMLGKPRKAPAPVLTSNAPPGVAPKDLPPGELAQSQESRLGDRKTVDLFAAAQFNRFEVEP